MRPTYLKINLSQLKRNLDAIRARTAPAKVLVNLKANAYGHGVDGVAPFIAPFADYLGVALAEEGIHLRELRVDKPILVMGGTLPEQLPLFVEYDLTLTASSPDLLTAAEQIAASSRKRLKVHLKIDTGMERVGVRDTEAESFLEQSLKCKHLEVEGIYTHLANSESVDLTHARLQIERFMGVLRFYAEHSLPPPPIRHMANSGGVLQLSESHLDMVRPGIMFYGIYPGAETQRTVEIHPAAVWVSHVAYSKVVPPGRPVSYGSLWQAEVLTRIVTVPCGYGDGYFRRMTNQAQVVIRGRKFPQVGRICMDQFMANVGDEDVRVGEEVFLLGEGIAPEDLARWTGTNEYEVMTNISARVPRVFVTDER